MNNATRFGVAIHPAAKSFGAAFCCGVEHELEKISFESWDDEDAGPALFNICKYDMEDDHSLVNGREIITWPNSVKAQIAFHEKLHSLPIFNGESCTDRCSTHVHVNATMLTAEQTLSLLKMYCLIEPYFFAFVGTEREQNIHCVPLWATGMGKNVFFNALAGDVLHGLPHSWHKYTALNVKPLMEIGTIEFRHLYATNDTKVFSNWLGFLKSLYDWAVDDNGKFHNETCTQLLKGGYSALQNYLNTLSCPLGKYLEILHPHVNYERCYDVYLLAVVDQFKGLSNVKNYIAKVSAKELA